MERVTDGDVTTRTCTNITKNIYMWSKSIEPERACAGRAGTIASPAPREATPWCETQEAETTTKREKEVIVRKQKNGKTTYQGVKREGRDRFDKAA